MHDYSFKDEQCKSLAIAYVEWQKFDKLYDDLEKAYKQGTVFRELDKPFIGRRCV